MSHFANLILSKTKLPRRSYLGKTLFNQICPNIVFTNKFKLKKKPHFDTIQEIIEDTSCIYDHASMIKNLEYYTLKKNGDSDRIEEI